MENNEPIETNKKTWQKPTIQILDSGYIEVKHRADFHEHTIKTHPYHTNGGNPSFGLTSGGVDIAIFVTSLEDFLS